MLTSSRLLVAAVVLVFITALVVAVAREACCQVLA
jgi:hypothetical protein